MSYLGIKKAGSRVYMCHMFHKVLILQSSFSVGHSLELLDIWKKLFVDLNKTSEIEEQKYSFP